MLMICTTKLFRSSVEFRRLVEPDQHEQKNEEPTDYQVGHCWRGPGDRGVGRRQGLERAARSLRVVERVLPLLVNFRVLSLRCIKREFGQPLLQRGLRGRVRGELGLCLGGIGRSQRIGNRLSDLARELTCLVSRNKLDDVWQHRRCDADQRIYFAVLPLTYAAGPRA